MKKVLCIAEVCCDIIFGNLNRIPILGEEEYCKEFGCKAGGGANTAMGLAKLGAPVSMFTELGDDAFGRIVYEHLVRTGVDKESIALDKNIRTAVSAVMSTREDRCFASFSGEGCFLGKDRHEKLEQMIRECGHVHTYAGYCLHSPILDLCRKYNKSLSLDTSFLPDAAFEELSVALSYCSFFTPNEGEAMAATGTSSPYEALEALSETAPNTVVTMGSKGSIMKIDGSIHHQPCISYGDAVDTTGAGDLFCSGLIYGLINGMDKEQCMHFAARTAGYSVTYYGGMDDSLSLESINVYE